MPPADRTLLTPLTVTASDGTSLHLERHASTGPARGSLILLHGFSVHSGQYRHVAETFARAGLEVTAMDCRGHGQSSGRRGYVRRFQDFQDDLHLVVEETRAAAPGLPVVVGGHSHGALIALHYALSGRSPIAALPLACPYLALRLRVPAWKRTLGKLMGWLWPTLAIGNELRLEETTRDPDARALHAGDPLAHHVATPRWFNEVEAAQAHIMTQASTLRVPTFMALAGDDRIVDTDASLRFARDAGAVVQVKVYPQAYHELFFEPEWRQIVEDLASWVVARLTAPYT
jgi:alpha-beta hydrolase superfamily lysophospholipase